jgi:hypothetical protein
MVVLGAACARSEPGEGAETDETETSTSGETDEFPHRQPVRDEWREELVLAAAGVRHLVVGGVLTSDNFANKGDIEVRYEEGGSEIHVELQRFTFAKSMTDAEQAFGRMSLWAYDLVSVEKPRDEIMQAACGVSDGDFCQIRVYYDGLYQPVRDGANLRVTLPRGWDGTLALETADNLIEEPEYPDRGDILVDGLAGNLEVRLDAGRVQVRLDPAYALQPASIVVEARSGRAAEILVDVPPDNYYTAELANPDAPFDPGCDVAIDCEAFPDCQLEPDNTLAVARATINYPGLPTPEGSGVHIDLHASACSMIDYADSPADYEHPATELRGNVRLCSGCADF